MKTNGEWRYSSTNLYLITSWMRVVRFTSMPLIPRKDPGIHWIGGHVGSRAAFWITSSVVYRAFLWHWAVVMYLWGGWRSVWRSKCGFRGWWMVTYSDIFIGYLYIQDKKLHLQDSPFELNDHFLPCNWFCLVGLVVLTMVTINSTVF
jgi:hypothetical protein